MSYAPRPPYGQVPPAKKKSSTTMIVLIVVGAVALLGLCCVGGGVALLLPAIQQAQQAARNAAQSSEPAGIPGGSSAASGETLASDPQLENELKALGIAYHFHADAYGPANSWDDLMRAPGIDAGALQSLRSKNVEVRWGTDLAKMTADGTPGPEYVLAYPTNAATEASPILFGDGHVETLAPDAFRAKLDQYPLATKAAAGS